MMELNVNAYLDTDFAGLYGYEDSLGPFCMRSRIDFSINVVSCLMLWKSQLQTGTATSMMQAEVVVLVGCCRGLMQNIDSVDEIGKAVCLTSSEKARMHVYIHKDSAGILILAQTLPPQFTQ